MQDIKKATSLVEPAPPPLSKMMRTFLFEEDLMDGFDRRRTVPVDQLEARIETEAKEYLEGIDIDDADMRELVRAVSYLYTDADQSPSPRQIALRLSLTMEGREFFRRIYIDGRVFPWELPEQERPLWTRAQCIRYATPIILGSRLSNPNLDRLLKVAEEEYESLPKPESMFGRIASYAWAGSFDMTGWTPEQGFGMSSWISSSK